MPIEDAPGFLPFGESEDGSEKDAEGSVVGDSDELEYFDPLVGPATSGSSSEGSDTVGQVREGAGSTPWVSPVDLEDISRLDDNLGDMSS